MARLQDPSEWAQEAAQQALNEIESILGVSLERLKELAQADKEGRCVILPVKPGTKVYSIRWWDDVLEEKELKDGGTITIQVMKHKVTKEKYNPFGSDFYDWGVEVFSTKGEAEEHLKRR